MGMQCPSLVCILWHLPSKQSLKTKPWTGDVLSCPSMSFIWQSVFKCNCLACSLSLSISFYLCPSHSHCLYCMALSSLWNNDSWPSFASKREYSLPNLCYSLYFFIHVMCHRIVKFCGKFYSRALQFQSKDVFQNTCNEMAVSFVRIFTHWQFRCLNREQTHLFKHPHWNA